MFPKKKMFWLTCASIYCVLSCCAAPGQSTVCSCADSVLEAFEGLQRRLEENDYRLETVIQNIRSLSSAFDKIKVKLIDDPQSTSIPDHCRSTSAMCDCSDIKANGYAVTGVYRIYVDDECQRYYANVFCDMTTTNDAWTVFQRRNDGSVDFYRGWNEYANGFGNTNGEFWLGDSLRNHTGQRFTTKDSDNDASSSENCAERHRGAWWYEGCYKSNLNGLNLRGPYNIPDVCSPSCFEGITWNSWRGDRYSLKATEMKISP